MFVLADLSLLIVSAWFIRVGGFLPPKTTGDYVVICTVIGLWAWAAYICISPWLVEFKAQTRHLENETLGDAMQQIQQLQDIGAKVQTATSSWQSAHDTAARTVASARDIEEKIKADMKDFTEFAERVNNEEKNHLRLEVEKLRRTEGEWLQVTARMLDHTWALTVAAQRTGQANLVAQMNNFQAACRDAARRMGLIPFQPAIGELFDVRGHQTESSAGEVPAGSVVSEVLATGYTFQGQLLRRALVRVSASGTDPAETAPAVAEASPESVEEVIETEPSVAEASEEQSHHPEQPSAVAEEPVVQSNLEELPHTESSEETIHEPEPEAVIEEAVAQSLGADSEELQLEAEPVKRRRAKKPDLQAVLPF